METRILRKVEASCGSDDVVRGAEWFELARQDLSPSTIIGYEACIRRYIGPALDDVPADPSSVPLIGCAQPIWCESASLDAITAQWQACRVFKRIAMGALAAATAMAVLTSCARRSSAPASSAYTPAVSQLVGEEWGSGPEPVSTTQYARAFPQLGGLVLSAVQSAAVDVRGVTYLMVTSGTRKSSERRAGPTFLAAYSARGRLISLRRLPSRLLACNAAIRHVDPIVLACASNSDEVAELSASGRVRWDYTYPPVQGDITFVSSVTQDGVEIYEWNDNPTSSSDAVTVIDLNQHGKVVHLQRSRMPVNDGGQVGLAWYSGGWVELATATDSDGSCAATVRGFNRSFRLKWTRQIPIDCYGLATDDEIGPVVVGDAVYAGVGSGPIEIGKFSVLGREEWLKSISVPEGGGNIGGFLMDASPASLWITGMVGNPEGGGPGAPQLDSVLQLQTATGAIAWQGRVVAQYPTIMSLKTKDWAYFQPQYGAIEAVGCRFTEVLEGDEGTRSIDLPVAASVTIGKASCSSHGG
jgi:hypothetical protein